VVQMQFLFAILLTDLYNPNLIRASLGSFFTVQTVACTNEQAYNWIQKQKLNIYTAQLQNSEWYYDADFNNGTALVMGSESNGLSNFWRELATKHIKIPMLGKMDSLNVSVSAGILCYEIVRQRLSSKKL
jgi:rRNA methylases